jgi:cell division protein FtsB
MTTAADSMTPLPLPQRSRGPWLRRVMLFMICVVLADSLFGERGLSERTRAIHAYEQATRDLSALRNENAGLREQVRRLRSDPETIELVVREELGLIRPGEVLFRFTP